MKTLNRSEKKQAKDVPWLGRFLARWPAWPIFYPLYEARQLDLVEDAYWSPHIPEAFDGFRIAYLADIHFGPLFPEERVRELVERVNALHADVTVLGGDYGVDSDGAVRFFQLKPGFYGSLAVLGILGNHDRMAPESNLEPLLQAMREDGVTPLVNDAFTVERQGQRLTFVGVDDYYCGAPDLEKAAALSENADFTIFLPHMPDILPEVYKLPGGPFYQLALCGHTHGGQVAIGRHAILSSSVYGSRYLTGWYHERRTDILVTNGVGTSALPVRLGARPQMHLITLRKE